MAETQEVLAKDRYEQLKGDRSTYLDTAVECAEYTIPYLIREEGSGVSTEYPNNYVRGMGAKYVNNLAGKLVKTIMPSNQPFHRLVAVKEAKKAISQGNEEVDNEIDKETAMIDEEVFRHINKSGLKSKMFEYMQNTIVAGNCLIEKVDNKFRLFNLRNYVVKRDSNGDVIELVILETLKKESLPDGIMEQGNEDDDNELYTRCVKKDKKYFVSQELNGVKVGTEYNYAKITERFIVGVWNLLSGEDYGRGYVEEQYDTLDDMNEHMEIISKSAKVNAKVVLTVDPNGMTKYKDFVKAETGDAIIGDAKDIGVVRTEKDRDLSSSIGIVTDYKKELAEAFLYVKGAIRDSERTTKYEVQVLLNELEGALGGVYTSMAIDIQLPQVEWALKDLKKDIGKDLEIDIISGADALSKNSESLKIQGLLEDLGALATIVGAESVSDEINVGNVISSMVANSGVASKKLTRTKAEKEALIESRKQAQIMSQAVNPAISSVATNVASQAVPNTAK